MKILMIDKFYFVKGGAERYAFELTSLLEELGHEVIPFGMTHPNNFQTPYASYFVDHVDYNQNRNIFKSMQSAAKTIYSTEAKKKIERLVRDTRPDIAHLHMIDHQISPSILPVFKKYHIPVVQTVHQYKLVCPNYRLFNMRTQTICEKCLDGHFWHPLFERCHMNSLVASGLIALESAIHKYHNIYEKNIDLFHVPSRFMGGKLKQGGIPEDKIHPLFYTIQLGDFKPTWEDENYFLYYGRLAKEKGVHTLIRTMRDLPDVRLLIAGDGPQRSELEEMARSFHLNHVEFLGIQQGEDLKNLIRKAKAIVVPSEWYDNSPLVIYEAFAMGKAVIGTPLGGIPELVRPDETGLLFPAGNSEALSESIANLDKNPHLVKQLGKQAHAFAMREFDERKHVEEMIGIYSTLITSKQAGGMS